MRGTKKHPLGGWDSSLSRALANSDRIMDVQAIKAIKGGVPYGKQFSTYEMIM